MLEAILSIFVSLRLKRVMDVRAKSENSDWDLRAYPGNSDTKVDKGVHSVLLCKGQPRVLIESSTILVGYTISILDVHCNDPNFVHITINPD